MQYSHHAQLSEIVALPAPGASAVVFWTGNARHSITAQDGATWSLLDSSGSILGEFVTADGVFAILDDDGREMEHCDNWRSAVRQILRRAVRAA